MNIAELYNIYTRYPSVQTDTRKLKPGDLFFALKGPNFNGNTFVQRALDSGAAYAVIDEKEYEVPGKTFLVYDVLQALQQLAHHHRKQFDTLPAGRQVPFIAITGSNGKTTTKELVHAVLGTTYETYTTEGNLNNHIGVPLTILKIRKEAEVAVIEMGANHLHEIESYCKIAAPTHGLITNCGKAHLEGFGSIEGVKKAKGELFDYLRTRPEATAFIMKDYDYLEAMSTGIANIVTYGTMNADVTGFASDAATLLKVHVNADGEQFEITTQLVGDYNLPNVLAAVAVGRALKVDAGKIKHAIETYTPSNSRSQLIERGTNKIILDAYNANPSSMKLAIENFAKIKTDQKILMLGAMAEMGSETEAEHLALIDEIKKYNWTHVVLVGKAFEAFSDRFSYFADSIAAGEWAGEQQFQNAFILIKGSRSLEMEKVLEKISN